MTDAADTESDAPDRGGDASFESLVEERDASAEPTATTDEAVETAAGEQPDPTPQDEALLRQQYYVGVGGGILAGMALATSLFQRFPEAPMAIHIFAGLVGFGIVIWLVNKSIFPSEGETTPPAE